MLQMRSAKLCFLVDYTINILSADILESENIAVPRVPPDPDPKLVLYTRRHQKLK